MTLLLSVLLLALFATPSPTPPKTGTALENAKPPKPTASVSFERATIRENDEVQARLIFANEWDKPLNKVVLHVHAPAFLSSRSVQCGQWGQEPTESVIDLGMVGPGEVKTASICFRSGSNIDVGDANISFTLDYAWIDNNNAERHSVVALEKTLKANLFGSDSVAGIPIVLAAFIVPGLFFWMVIGRLKLPWSVGDLPLGEKLIYSVLVSLLLLWLLNLGYPQNSSGIGLGKLGFYALLGLAAGVVIGGADYLRRKRKKSRTEIKPGDEADVMLGKLLNLYPNAKTPRAVVKTKEAEYVGSLGAKTNEIVGLVGWFQVTKTNILDSNRDAIIKELEQAQRPLDLFNLARKHSLKIEPRDPITEKKGEEETQQSVGKTFPVEDVTVEQFQTGGSSEPLVLA